MNGAIPINEEERARQQAMSERPATIEERGNVGGIATETPVGEVASSFEDEVEAEAVSQVLVESQLIALPQASTAIADWAQSNEIDMVRVNVTGSMNFVLDMFHDDVHQALEENGNVEIDGIGYNLLQPLNKYNERSNRIGLLTERVRNLIENVRDFDNLSSLVLLPVDFADDAINNLVEARAQHVMNLMFDGLPIDETLGEPAIQFDSGDVIPATRIFYPSFRTAYRLPEDESGVVEVTIEVFVRVRVPILLRTESDKIESTLIRYAKHLNKLAVNAELESEVFMIFRTQDLFKEPVWNLLSIVRENFEDADLYNGQDYYANSNSVFHAPGQFDPVFGQGDILIGLTNELIRRDEQAAE